MCLKNSRSRNRVEAVEMDSLRLPEMERKQLLIKKELKL